MSEVTALAILADNFYHCNLKSDEALAKAESVLDELESAGFVLVFSPRKKAANG